MRTRGPAFCRICAALDPWSAGAGGKFRLYGGLAADHRRTFHEWTDSSAFLSTLGILLFSAAVLFQLVTLPVEFNASNRAVKVLETSGMLYPDEVGSVKKVLGAAALTYVASAASMILQLLRLIILTGGRRRND